MTTSGKEKTPSMRISLLPDEWLSELAGGLLGFFEKLAGPAAEELGLRFGESVRLYRLKNQVRILESAQKLLDDADIPVDQVPLRTLVPLLEGASLEDEPLLQDMWAALLANAGSSRRGSDVPPAYPEIMRQLSPIDANVLSKGFTTWGLPSPARSGWTSREVLASRAGEEHIQGSIDNLVRLGLIKIDGGLEDSMKDVEEFVGDVIRYSKLNLTREVRFRSRGTGRTVGDMALTTLGVGFLIACSPPLVLPLALPVTSASPRNEILKWISLAEGLAAELAAEAELSRSFSESARIAHTWFQSG